MKGSVQEQASSRLMNKNTSRSLTLNELFEQQVDTTPQNLALITENNRLSYLDLDCLSNQLAHYMRSLGVGPGKFVGIHLERSEKPIIAMLATLKTGAAYIPLEPSLPEARFHWICSKTNISLILTEKALAKQNLNEQIHLDDFSFLSTQSPKRLTRGDTGSKPNDLCYILFTSGTTGTPKGIMTEHHNVVNFIDAFNKVIGLRSSDRIYQGFPLGFDGSVEELWMAFSNGAALVVSNPLAAKLPEEAARIMNTLKVTVCSTVPTFLSLIQKPIQTLRLIILSGEPCPEKLIKTWSTQSCQVANVYGPTETTVNATIKYCQPNNKITIGSPLEGYELYILEKNLAPVAPGKIGELYIGGVGVARGYHNNAELTQQSFIDNPFAKDGSEKMFKTGDRVRRLPNGELEFIGRNDTQVKIRGFRVELSEIEAAFKHSALIDEVIVTTVEVNHHKELVAYVIPNTPMEPGYVEGIRTLLRQRLPGYMIPRFIELVAEFPRLSNGKVDRKALPNPITPSIATTRSVIRPTNAIEQKLVAVWKKIFNQEQISITSDFFTDLGGYSILAVEMVSLLRDQYNIDISVRDVYLLKTIKEIAHKINTPQQHPQENFTQQQKINSKEVFESVSKGERYCVYFLQALVLLCFTSIATSIMGGGVVGFWCDKRNLCYFNRSLCIPSAHISWVPA